MERIARQLVLSQLRDMETLHRGTSALLNTVTAGQRSSESAGAFRHTRSRTLLTGYTLEGF